MRHDRGQSLDDLSRQTGISKPMLSQIERGVSNPTVGTLWKIATGLGMPFTALVADHEPLRLTRAANQPRIVDDEGRFEAYATLGTSDPAMPVEVYRVRLHPAGRRASDGHGIGVFESLIVFSGQLALEIQGVRHDLAPGDALTFAADRPHVYRNEGRAPCEFSETIIYQSSRSTS